MNKERILALLENAKATLEFPNEDQGVFSALEMIDEVIELVKENENDRP